MGLRDLILFTVIFTSAAVAILVPRPWTFLQPFILYFMMTLLFLAFLRIDFRALLDTSGSSLLRLAILTVAKLVIVPVLLFFATSAILPEYAIPVLLLSGISTGVVAPFIATLVFADLTVVLRMVIVTSFLVPFTLPVLVEVLAGAELDIPLLPMVRLLALVIFVPMILVVVLRRVWPAAPPWILARQYPVSLTIFGTINLAVFSKYSDFFFAHPGEILVSVGVAYVLSAIYYTAGYVCTPGSHGPVRLGGGVGMAIMNNVLVIVFASQFFGPLSPMLAAMYMFPFFTMIVPVKVLAAQARILPETEEAV